MVNGEGQYGSFWVSHGRVCYSTRFCFASYTVCIIMTSSAKQCVKYEDKYTLYTVNCEVLFMRTLWFPMVLVGLTMQISESQNNKGIYSVSRLSPQNHVDY